MLTPFFYVLTGQGINCELETQFALENSGARAEIIHINDLIKRASLLKNAQGLIIPGGFSYGDEIGSGQILALKIEKNLKYELLNELDRGMAVCGICNGFQVLVKLGLLPDGNQDRSIGLVKNDSQKFIDCWVKMEKVQSTCWWTEHINQEFLEMPIRHGEGKLVFKDNDIYLDMVQNKQIVLRYNKNYNGSSHQVAGICNKNGNIFGLMPHPEAAIFNFHKSSPAKALADFDGRLIFDSIIKKINSL